MKVSLFRLLIVTACILMLFVGLVSPNRAAPPLQEPLPLNLSAQPLLSDRVGILESGSITGTVTSLTGNPLPNVEIRVYGYDGTTWLEAVRVWTNTVGLYTVGGLEAGAYRIRFWDWSNVYGYEYYDNAPNLNNATDIIVTAGGVTPGINAVLALAGSMTGRVSRPSGEPLAGIEVGVYRDDGVNWELVRRDYSTSTGFYTINGLSAGAYRVKFLDPAGIYDTKYYNNATSIESATDILVTPPGTTADIDAVLEGFYRTCLPLVVR